MHLWDIHLFLIIVFLGRTKDDRLNYKKKSFYWQLSFFSSKIPTLWLQHSKGKNTFNYKIISQKVTIRQKKGAFATRFLIPLNRSLINCCLIMVISRIFHFPDKLIFQKKMFSLITKSGNYSDARNYSGDYLFDTRWYMLKMRRKESRVLFQRVKLWEVLNILRKLCLDHS